MTVLCDEHPLTTLDGLVDVQDSVLYFLLNRVCQKFLSTWASHSDHPMVASSTLVSTSGTVMCRPPVIPA